MLNRERPMIIYLASLKVFIHILSHETMYGGNQWPPLLMIFFCLGDILSENTDT